MRAVLGDLSLREDGGPIAVHRDSCVACGSATRRTVRLRNLLPTRLPLPPAYPCSPLDASNLTKAEPSRNPGRFSDLSWLTPNPPRAFSLGGGFFTGQNGSVKAAAAQLREVLPLPRDRVAFHEIKIPTTLQVIIAPATISTDIARPSGPASTRPALYTSKPRLKKNHASSSPTGFWPGLDIARVISANATTEPIAVTPASTRAVASALVILSTTLAERRMRFRNQTSHVRRFVGF